MNTQTRCFLAVTGLAVMTSAASAGITFSNVTVTSGLEDHISWYTSAQDIDFVFDSTVQAFEGQPEELSFVISYDAHSGQNLTQDTMVLSVLGGLLGSGEIMFSERIFDISVQAGAGLLVDYSVVLNADNNLPHVADLMFAYPATDVHVEKRITLRAPNTDAIDLSSISLIEQRFVPTPGAMALMGLGGITTLRRRR